jgi:hypothetical protein
VPEPEEQVNVLPALVADNPATAEIEMTLLAGKVSVHCNAAGSLPAGEVRVRFKETVPLVAVVPEDRANESVCPKETWAVNKSAKSDAIQPLAERLIMSML